MDPINALCATYRLILFGIDVTQVPSTVRHSLELVRTCYHDLQHLIELRQVCLSLLEKRPAVLQRVNSIISTATEGLVEVCAIVEKCRPEAHRGRTGFRCRFQWIFFDEKDFHAHEPVIARHHAAVLAELNFLRQILLFTPIAPVEDGKGEADGKRKGTMFFDNVALWGDLFGGPSDAQLAILPAETTSLATSKLSKTNLAANRAFQDSKQLDIIPKLPTATEPTIANLEDDNEHPITGAAAMFEPSGTSGLAPTSGGGHDFPLPSPSLGSASGLSATQSDMCRRVIDLPKRQPVPWTSPMTCHQGDADWLSSFSPVDATNRDTVSRKMFPVRPPSPLVPSQPTTSSSERQRPDWAQSVSSISTGQHVAPDLTSQTAYTFQPQKPNWDRPLPSDCEPAQINVLGKHTLEIPRYTMDGLSTGIPYYQMGGNIANGLLAQLHNTPRGATSLSSPMGQLYPLQSQVVELPQGADTQARMNPRDQLKHYETEMAPIELEALPQGKHAYNIYELPGS
ncbi:hypothetical protein FOQG_16766 [Fusarium oxysporum f. sp. raphani 54005]|uniref:Uncharacterized protein n=2 Tax=Fusarium oxysporum f. sp. raphani TaxID=96318 RepID=X0B9X8_FUSOX|nr:hypothetical protein FOQG_16766 [Fusarium oxysporum f. sp. raphani 54005]KAG7437364.1 hypothetical protein Forpi1262_v000011 [Fusarium oxysporum f. sp. raphani]